MHIFNASLDEIADTFLHPGYMSAYAEVTVPGPMNAAIIPVDKEPVVQIDMAYALRLTRDLDQAIGALSAPPRHELAFGWLGLLAVGLALSPGHRLSRFFRRLPTASLVLGGLAALALVIAAACAEDARVPGARLGLAARPSPSARQSAPRLDAVPSAPFEDPRAATEAILNGIVADAVACSRASEITSLASVSEQVGLPGSYRTAGMRWAVANYQDDGWGRRFRLRALGKDRFQVSSAAEDGVFETQDDIALEMRRAGAFDWPQRIRAYYLRREGDEVGVSFHRCGNTSTRHRYVGPPGARGLVGDALFGLLPEHDFPEAKRRALRGRLAQATGGQQRDALVLVAFDPKHVGRLPAREVMVPLW
jgi:hypothetical protein